MAHISPFKAYRPAPTHAAEVAALPYDVLSTREARLLAEKNPRSFLCVDKAEIAFGDDVPTYDDAVYAKAAAEMERLIGDGTFILDDAPRMYVYRLTRLGHAQTGLVCCAAVDDYVSGVIKKNENTREDKERDRIRHIEALNAHTGPIFLAHRANRDITALLDGVTQAPALYDFTADDGVKHAVWIVPPDVSARLTALFACEDSLYIADGHHRTAAAAKVAAKRRENGLNTDESDRFLSVIFPAEQLLIMDYNRVVRTLNGLSPQQFLSSLKKDFIVEQAAQSPFRPGEKGVFGLYTQDCWYALKVRSAKTDILSNLDVSLLSDLILAPLLGITDLRSDKNIDFIGGGRGLNELERLVDGGGFVAAFSMFPTSMGELMAVADGGLLMPPKSTWFEPKLRSGLFVHKF